jgi:putative flippase GtrA
VSKAFIGGEFGRFLITGGVAACVNVLSRWLLSHAVIYELAVALAYLVGMVTAYGLSRAFVFAHSGRSITDEAGRFALVNLVALAQVWVVSIGLARLVFPAVGFVWHAEDVAHLIGVAVPAVTSYFGHRHFSFATRRGGDL